MRDFPEGLDLPPIIAKRRSQGGWSRASQAVADGYEVVGGYDLRERRGIDRRVPLRQLGKSPDERLVTIICETALAGHDGPCNRRRYLVSLAERQALPAD